MKKILPASVRRLLEPRELHSRYFLEKPMLLVRKDTRTISELYEARGFQGREFR